MGLWEEEGVGRKEKEEMMSLYYSLKREHVLLFCNFTYVYFPF